MCKELRPVAIFASIAKEYFGTLMTVFNDGRSKRWSEWFRLREVTADKKIRTSCGFLRIRSFSCHCRRVKVPRSVPSYHQIWRVFATFQFRRSTELRLAVCD